MIFSYRLDLPKEEARRHTASAEPRIASALCWEDQTRAALLAGAIIVYSYVDQDGAPVDDIAVTEEDCH